MGVGGKRGVRNGRHLEGLWDLRFLACQRFALCYGALSLRVAGCNCVKGMQAEVDCSRCDTGAASEYWWGDGVSKRGYCSYSGFYESRGIREYGRRRRPRRRLRRQGIALRPRTNNLQERHWHLQIAVGKGQGQCMLSTYTTILDNGRLLSIVSGCQDATRLVPLRLRQAIGWAAARAHPFASAKRLVVRLSNRGAMGRELERA